MHELETSNPIIRIKYFLRVKNVGDRINADLISTLFRLRTIYYSGDSKNHLLGVGSLISASSPLSIIWGTGLMSPDNGIGNADARSHYALRGKLTYQAVKESGVPLSDIPLGDPAYLIRNTLLHRHLKKKYRLGVVPHYVDRNDPRIEKIINENGVVFLNVHDDPDIFLSKMSECDAVASSSLHGLIFAEALSIPNVWLHLSDRVVGDGFKFRDWFSMAEKPQTSPFSPTDNDHADELIKRAMLHDCQIDRATLKDAFPIDKIDELAHDLKGRPFISLYDSRRSNIPIFIISYNRGSYLLKTIKSYINFGFTKIIIHDNGSDNDIILRILEKLENKIGFFVFYGDKIHDADDLNNVDNTIHDYFSNWAEPSRYVVTDCDVDIEKADPLAMEVFGELLDEIREAQCVGPMLTIRDIPRSYSLFNHVMNRHIEQFWEEEPDWVTISKGRVATRRGQIDTTFSLHRAGERFRRGKEGIRVYYPYEATHLDWYSDTRNDDVYSHLSSYEISHWSNSKYVNDHKNDALKYESFLYVGKSDIAESLEVKRRHLNRLTHAVVIRFHYSKKYPKDKLEWRFSYFSSMVLPRLLHQTNKEFVIAVRTTADLAARFHQLSQRIITFDVKAGFENWVPPGYEPLEFRLNRQKFFSDFVPWDAVEGLPHFDIQTSIASDDLILRDDFIDRIESECCAVSGTESLHIQFQPYIYDVPSFSFHTFKQPYSVDNGSMFFSLYQSKKDNYVYVGQDSHRHIGKLMDQSVMIDYGYVAASTHWANASTTLHVAGEKVDPKLTWK